MFAWGYFENTLRGVPQWAPLTSNTVEFGDTVTYNTFDLEWDRYTSEEEALTHCELPILIVSPASTFEGEQEEAWGCPKETI